MQASKIFFSIVYVLLWAAFVWAFISMIQDYAEGDYRNFASLLIPVIIDIIVLTYITFKLLGECKC
jgi:hypothetical protein